jgi:hypothetical protein
VKLADALPDLVLDLETPLVQLGRGDLLAQVKDATLAGWKYDDFADTTTLDLDAGEPVEILSLYDELGVNLEMDSRGRLCRIEVLDGKAIAKRLESHAR